MEKPNPTWGHRPTREDLYRENIQKIRRMLNLGETLIGQEYLAVRQLQERIEELEEHLNDEAAKAHWLENHYPSR